MTQGINDKVVVITGASSGLGELPRVILPSMGPNCCWERGASQGFRHSPKSFRWAMTPPCRPT
jgi:hypothetical protein